MEWSDDSFFPVSLTLTHTHTSHMNKSDEIVSRIDKIGCDDGIKHVPRTSNGDGKKKKNENKILEIDRHFFRMKWRVLVHTTAGDGTPLALCMKRPRTIYITICLYVCISFHSSWYATETVNICNGQHANEEEIGFILICMKRWLLFRDLN